MNKQPTNGTSEYHEEKPKRFLLKRVSSIDKIFFTQHLEVMIRTGFAAAGALDAISRAVNNSYFKSVILELQKGIERGETLSENLEKYPKIFSEIYISMIRSGEVSGKLDSVLKQLTIQQRKRYELIATIRSALAYPVIVIMAMIVIGTGMAIFVLPRITEIYEDVDVELPLPTRIVIGMSHVLGSYGIFIGAGVVLLVVGFILWYRTKEGKLLWHRFFLKLPVAAPILKKMNLAAFARNFSSLIQTDIPIIETLQIIARTMPLVPYREHLAKASLELEKGVEIHTVLEARSDLFPSPVPDIISIGEQTGTLDSVSGDLASFYEEDVSNTMKGLTTLIEPLLLLVLGVVVGGIAVAVLLPIYSLVQTI
ncbi:MAG: type II secretion system F family protein [Candidatus Kerfeldbacteria bacterium]|nr:type II secretion system F family protein [Candidatus Kerfeldbacteria bacterium]